MPGKRHSPQDIVAKLRQVDALTGQGIPILDAVRSIEVTLPTYRKWLAMYGGVMRTLSLAPVAASLDAKVSAKRLKP